MIEKNNVVSIGYVLKDNGGKVIDSSENGQPLVYLHGTGQILPALEKAIEGRKKGDKFKISLTPEQGYGEYDQQLKQTVPRSAFPAGQQIEEGMQFQVETNDGTELVTAVEVRADEIVLDGNHPLAGVPLNFEIEIIEIRKATQEELAHGHAHGPGGHHH